MNLRVLGAFGALDVLVVAVAAHRYGNSGAASTIAALALAPCAVFATARVAARIGGARFGVFAAAVYTALPAIGAAYMLSTYRSTFLRDALPSLLGLRSPGWLALGVVLVIALAAVPQSAAAGAGALLAAWAVVRYDVGDLSGIRVGLHETAWSTAIAEWFIVAGPLGTARRSWRMGVGLAGILVFAILRAAHDGYDDAAFWKHLGVATPTIALLLSSTVLLVPRLRPAKAPAAATRP